MIVRPGHDCVHLITQPDHAHLARAVMEHCVPLAARERRAAILHAIDEHDSGWAEPDAAPIVDRHTGRVVDFVHAPLSVRQAGAPRAIATLADDPWAAALVAQHGLTVYSRFRSEREWTAFFSALEATRAAVLRATGRSLDELTADYAFVRLGDLISLAACTGWTHEERFGEWTVQRSGTCIVVTPDPFGGMEVPTAIGARVIPDRPFRSDRELREALTHANTTTLIGSVAGPWSSSGDQKL